MSLNHSAESRDDCLRSLGAECRVELRQGPIEYRERGSGPTLVFVHGILATGDTWRNVVPELGQTGAQAAGAAAHAIFAQ